MSTPLIQGIVFAVYMIAMILIGFCFYSKDSSQSEYVLGGRQMNVWVTSMSAQASDMSGWLLMGLPGTAYLLGGGNRSHMDCFRACRRYISQLAYCGKTAQKIYADCGKFAYNP